MSPKEDPEKSINDVDIQNLQSSNSKTRTEITTTIDLRDADEAFAFLSTHPRAADLTIEEKAILEDPLQNKKLLRKIDRTILLLLAAVYFLQYLDKTTLSYAAVMGIREDAKLIGQEYAIISMLFYLGFLLAEFPTQYLAQHNFRLSLYRGLNIILRGFHPRLPRGLHYIYWSCNMSIPTRSIRILCSAYSGADSCYVVSKRRTGEEGELVFMVCELESAFLVYGGVTMGVGGLVCVFLPDSPVKAKRFGDAEKVATLLRVMDNQSGTQNSHLKKHQVFETFRDIRVWIICTCTLLISIPNGGLSTFSSILLTTFGYSNREALILTAPVGAIAVIFVLGMGYLSDKWNDTSLVMLLCIIPTILSAILAIAFDPNGIPQNKAGLLAASFMVGTFGAAFMLLLAWNASNIAGHTKKVTLNSMALVCFAVGNILGTQTFQSSQAPGYIGGKISVIVTLGALCFMVLVLRWYNDRLNRENEKILEGMEEDEKAVLRENMAFTDETDRRNVFFRYTH